jgi:hypothetical protein
MLAVCCKLVSCFILSSALLAQARYFFTTSFGFQRTKRCYIQKIQLFIQISVYISVGIATGYGLDDLGVGVQILIKIGKLIPVTGLEGS